MLALTAALILAAMTAVAVPAMAQQTKEETKTEEKSEEEENDKGKDEMKEDEKKDLLQSGGVSVDVALLGLTAGTLLVGGGLVARRVNCGDRGSKNGFVYPG